MSPTLRNRLNSDKGKGVRQWTGSETSELIANIKRQLKFHDSLPYSRRINAVKWEEISIPCRSVNECRSRLDVVIKKIHKIRTLAEILSDVEIDVDMADVDKIAPVNIPICDEMKTIDSAYKDQDTGCLIEEPFSSAIEEKKSLGNDATKIGPAINGDDDVVIMEEETVIQTTEIDEQLDGTDLSINMNFILIETDVTDEPEARQEIKSSVTDSHSSLANDCWAKAFIEPEQPIKLEKPDMKQECRDESLVACIKKFYNGFLGWLKGN